MLKSRLPQAKPIRQLVRLEKFSQVDRKIKGDTEKVHSEKCRVARREVTKTAGIRREGRKKGRIE